MLVGITLQLRARISAPVILHITFIDVIVSHVVFPLLISRSVSAQGCGWAVPGEWRKITDTWTESV